MCPFLVRTMCPFLVRDVDYFLSTRDVSISGSPNNDVSISGSPNNDVSISGSPNNDVSISGSRTMCPFDIKNQRHRKERKKERKKALTNATRNTFRKTIQSARRWIELITGDGFCSRFARRRRICSVRRVGRGLVCVCT